METTPTTDLLTQAELSRLTEPRGRLWVTATGFRQVPLALGNCHQL